MQETVKPLDISRIWLYFGLLFLVALVAFWPSYFALGLGASSVYAHVHATSAAMWMSLLIIQPWLIKGYKYDLHRLTGRISFVLVPLILISMLLLANFRIRSVSAADYPIQTYVLYLQVSLAALFAISYILAMVFRRDADVHARFMVCTGLTLIDPVFARLIFWVNPAVVDYQQWMTFGLTDLVFLILIWLERRNRNARWVFPAMLVVFLLLQIPALFWWTNWPIWQSFSEWFRSIPLT